jgi:hypothetical protein
MKSKTKATKRRGEQQYPAYLIAVILSAMLLLEGFLLGVATPGAWEKGLEVLDISSAVQAVASDVAVVVEPLMEQYDNVNTFYQMAATEMMVMLDVSDTDPFAFFRGVNEFYRLASIEMAELLDFSDDLAALPQVAGASISR